MELLAKHLWPSKDFEKAVSPYSAQAKIKSDGQTEIDLFAVLKFGPCDEKQVSQNVLDKSEAFVVVFQAGDQVCQIFS
jgi:capsule polysaccharide export protein KpsE/RkpR